MIYTALEDFIIEIYTEFDLYRLKNHDLEDVAARFGAVLYEDAPGNRVVNDMILLKHAPAAEKREAFSHELGHYLRHAGTQKYMPIGYRHYTEWQADQFAYHFCIPTFMLLEDTLPFCKERAVLHVVNKYGVTKRFASQRLEMFEQKFIAYY